MRNPDTLSAGQTTRNEDTPEGLAFAIGAYGLWGFLPLYMKAIAHIPAAEIVVHRIIWSVPVGAMVLIMLGRTATLREAFRSPRTLLMGCVTASLISVNWGIYIWAVNSGHALDAALGYYINPLFSILRGACAWGTHGTFAGRRSRSCSGSGGNPDARIRPTSLGGIKPDIHLWSLRARQEALADWTKSGVFA